MHQHETVMDVIKRRRTIRKYKGEALPDDVVRVLLEAAMCAPSAGDEKPWLFIVCNERECLDKLGAAHPYAPMMGQVKTAILICLDKKQEHLMGQAALGCAAAAQNLLIAAESRHLAAAWLGVFPDQERIEAISKALGLPENVVPFALIPVGEAGEEKLPKDRFDGSKIRYNKW